MPLWHLVLAAALLQSEVAAMNVDNFVVRPKRRLVEKYAKPEAWIELQPEAFDELAHEVAGLPAELDADPALAHRTLLTLTKAEGLRDQKELA